jgi:peptidyl-prolyl cis-trans isomerase C
MSIVRLRKVFRKKIEVGVGKKKFSIGSPMELIFWIIVVIFVVGAYYTFGGPSSRSTNPTDKAQAQRKVSAVVATVDGQNISREDFDRQYQMMSQNVPTGQLVTQDRYLKTSILEGLTDRLLKTAACKKENIKITSADVDKKVEENIKETMDRAFPTRKALAKFLAKNNTTVDAYKDKLRREMMQNRQQLEESVKFQKLEDTIKSRVQVTDKDLEDNYTKVKARHILITPDKMKKTDEEAAKGAQQATKDYKALAKQKAEDLLARIKKGEDFAKLAQENSDDPGSASQGGLLASRKPSADGKGTETDEYFTRGTMVPEFENAAFSLKPGEVSNIVETSYGFHIIQVLDRKLEYPADFAQKKEDYRKQLLEQKKNEAWTQYTEGLKKAAKIEIQDSELAAYKKLEDGDKTDAVKLLNTAVQNDATNIGAKYQLATLLKDTNEKDAAIKLFKELTENDRSAGSPEVRMDLAELYMGKNMKKEAIDEYKAASDWAGAYDYQNMFIHQQLKAKFTELGQADLATAEQKWMDDFQKQQQESGGMGGGLGGLGGGMPITIPPSSAPAQGDQSPAPSDSGSSEGDKGSSN